MKKYLDSGGREIEVGDLVLIGDLTRGITFTKTVTQKLLDEGVEDGTLRCIEVDEGGTHLDLEFYVEHLANRIGWKVDNLERYLNNLYKINPTAVFTTLLREIAIVLDQKYPDHIERSKEIWTFSTINGEIMRIPEERRSRIKNFRNFAAFRTLDDAKVAKHVLKRALQELFSRPNKKGGK